MFRQINREGYSKDATESMIFKRKGCVFLICIQKVLDMQLNLLRNGATI